MTSQTTGRVFQLAMRFVKASGGRRSGLRLPCKVTLWVECASMQHLPCGSLKQKQTAERIDWPPDRRVMHTIASPPVQTMLRRMLDAVPPTTTPVRQENVNQTAPPEESQSDKTPCESDDCQKGTTRNMPEAQTAEPLVTFTSPWRFTIQPRPVWALL